LGSWNSIDDNFETTYWSSDFSYNPEFSVVAHTYTESGLYYNDAISTRLEANLAESYTIGNILYIPAKIYYSGEINIKTIEGDSITIPGFAWTEYTGMYNPQTFAYLGLSGELNQYNVAENFEYDGHIFDIYAHYIGYETYFNNDIFGRIIHQDGTYSYIEFNVSEVPIPASILLFVSGLALTFLIKRYFKRSDFLSC
jgi:hypothetical protein